MLSRDCVLTHAHTHTRRVPIYTGWQYFRHPVQRAQGRGYLPRSTTQRLARKAGHVTIPLVCVWRGGWSINMCMRVYGFIRLSISSWVARVMQLMTGS